MGLVRLLIDHLCCYRDDHITSNQVAKFTMPLHFDFILMPGQACDLEGSDALLPNITAGAVLADKAFDADERVINPLEQAGIKVVIPPKSNRKKSAHL